ncbi:DUF192 domain-containing protein [Pleurocapsales cyanobacterium LEGE 10410]|nr:DUF192 domain-containing protein [Pleurocapsales cyanobacterium LEGE 10410]
MKFNLNLSIALLILLSGCSFLSTTKKAIANDFEEIRQEQHQDAARQRNTTLKRQLLYANRGQMLPITAVAEIGQEYIQLEVAQTPKQQSTGLMFRETLADNRGMLFTFESARIARFWMKNVPISLDMVFLNGDRVIDIAANVPPCKSNPCPVYGPEALVDRVIELRGGRAQELGIQAGDTIAIKSLNVEEK